jgi:hypothetical protein
VDCGSDQGRSVFEAAGVAALRRGLQKRENAELGRKTPIFDGQFKFYTNPGLMQSKTYVKKMG